LGYNTTNGQVVYSGTNPLTFTNPLAFGDTTNTASIRTNLGLGATNYPVFRGLEITDGDTLYINPSNINADTFGLVLNFEERNFAQDGATVFQWNTNSFTVTPPATFSTNVTVNGNLSVGSLTTTTPSTWALDATQTAADTGILDLPSNANVIRLTNNNAISGVSGGVLGAFYYLVNQTTNAVTISNVGGITVQGGTPLTLGANQAATLVATGATNASVAARGDLTDVALGGTANTAPSQTADSGASLMTRDLVDARYQYVRNPTTITITNNATLTNIVSVPLSVGTWTVKMFWDMIGTANSGTRHGFEFTGSATVRLVRSRAATGGNINGVALLSGNLDLGLAETSTLAFVTGIYEVSSSGTLYLKAAQNVSSADATTVGSYAHILAEKIE
jgi:hypothetical protein